MGHWLGRLHQWLSRSRQQDTDDHSMPEVYYTPEPSPGTHSTGEYPAGQQPSPAPPSPAEAPALCGEVVGRVTCPVLTAGSESWSEGAEMLDTAEADAADVQVSKGSHSPSWLHASPASLGALCGLWSSTLVPCWAAAVGVPGPRTGDAPRVPHVGYSPVRALTTLSGALLMVSLSRAVSTEGPGLPQSSLVSPSAASGLSGLLSSAALQATAGLGIRRLQLVFLQVASPLSALLVSLSTSLAAELLLCGSSSPLCSVMPGCSFQGIAVCPQSVPGQSGLSRPHRVLSISPLSPDGRGLAPDLGASGL